MAVRRGSRCLLIGLEVPALVALIARVADAYVTYSIEYISICALKRQLENWSLLRRRSQHRGLVAVAVPTDIHSDGMLRGMSCKSADPVARNQDGKLKLRQKKGPDCSKSGDLECVRKRGEHQRRKAVMTTSEPR